MKHYLLLVLFFFTLSLNAQFMVADMEDDGVGKDDCIPTAEWVGDPNVPVVSFEPNPNPSGINTTGNCVKFVETTGSNQFNSLQLAFNNTTAKTGHNLAANKFLRFMVYSENQTSFDILLELGTGGTPHLSATQTITTALNTWTQVEFDFTADDGAMTTDNWKTNIRIHFNNATAGSGDTYYVDEYSVAMATVLPVELTKFSGKTANEGIQLNWETASELNNSGFEVQKSQDGKSYETIAIIDGNGTTLETSEYAYLDTKATAGTNYYRLKQIDFDGKSELSEVILVIYKAEKAIVSEFYPNPAVAGKVNLNYEATNEEVIVVTVFDLTGKLLIIKNQAIAAGNNPLNLDFSTLAKGVYIVKIGDTHRKLIIE